MPKLRLPKVKSRDLIRDEKWTLFPGDTVQVIGGERPTMVGQTGKVLDVVRKMNSVTVDGLKMAKKHIRPNPIRPRGAVIAKPMPIHVSNLRIIDPHVGKPTQAKIIERINRNTGRLEKFRWLKESGTELPVPVDDGPIDKYETSIHDTPKTLLTQHSWKPSILNIPFPPRFMNQMERLRRMNSGQGEF